MLYFFVFQVRIESYDYIGVGNSTNKKDAQANAARDFVQFLVRQGSVQQSEVPLVSTWFVLFRDRLLVNLIYFYALLPEVLKLTEDFHSHRLLQKMRQK